MLFFRMKRSVSFSENVHVSNGSVWRLSNPPSPTPRSPKSPTQYTQITSLPPTQLNSQTNSSRTTLSKSTISSHPNTNSMKFLVHLTSSMSSSTTSSQLKYSSEKSFDAKIHPQKCSFSKSPSAKPSNSGTKSTHSKACVIPNSYTLLPSNSWSQPSYFIRSVRSNLREISKSKHVPPSAANLRTSLRSASAGSLGRTSHLKHRRYF